MENLNPIFTLFCINSSIGLNTNILETGLLNIFALLAILIYTGQDFLGSLLDERKTTIVKSIQDAEDRLREAQQRLTEAQKQLNQSAFIIDEIKNETIITKKMLLESEASQMKKDLRTRFDRALANLRAKERQIFLDIKHQIVHIVLQKTVSRLQETFKSNERASILIDETISKLEGDLL